VENETGNDNLNTGDGLIAGPSAFSATELSPNSEESFAMPVGEWAPGAVAKTRPAWVTPVIGVTLAAGALAVTTVAFGLTGGKGVAPNIADEIPSGTASYAVFNLDPEGDQKDAAESISTALGGKGTFSENLKTLKSNKQFMDAAKAQGVNPDPILKDLEIIAEHANQIGFVTVTSDSNDGALLLETDDNAATEEAVKRLLATAQTAAPKLAETMTANGVHANDFGNSKVGHTDHWVVVGNAATVDAVLADGDKLSGYQPYKNDAEKLNSDNVAEMWIRDADMSEKNTTAGSLVGEVVLKKNRVNVDFWTPGSTVAEIANTKPMKGDALEGATDGTKTFAWTGGKAVIASNKNAIGALQEMYSSFGGGTEGGADGNRMSDGKVKEIFGADVEMVKNADTVVGFLVDPFDGASTLLGMIPTGSMEGVTDESLQALAERVAHIKSMSVYADGDHGNVSIVIK
jgi:hypothetical protein